MRHEHPGHRFRRHTGTGSHSGASDFHATAASYGPCPPTYLALSIIVTVLCCLPFGIVGIVKSSNVSKEYAAGNYAKAKDASKQAKTWSIIGLCCGLFWIILYIILLACGFMAGLADL